MNKATWSGDSAFAKIQDTGNVEWYTPEKYIRPVRKVLGTIELDPASCEAANLLIKADRYYSLHDNGLVQAWNAKTLFLNPPYGRTGHRSNQEIWSCKLIAEYEAGNVEQALLLVNANTETTWFQRLFAYPICFVKQRINFYGPSGKDNGATHGSAFVYFGSDVARFSEVFGEFGRVVPAIPVVSSTSIWEIAS